MSAEEKGEQDGMPRHFLGLHYGVAVWEFGRHLGQGVVL